MTHTIPFHTPLLRIHTSTGNPRAAAPATMPVATPATCDTRTYEDGVRETQRAMSEQLLAQRAEFLELQRGVLASLEQAVSKVARDTESALIALAVESARKVVAGLPVNAEMVSAVVREAVSQVEDKTEITVLLHPDDLALLEPPADDRAIHYRSSPEISRGGCMVQTRFGLADARRETKFDQIKKAVRE